jgi:hypothetical protein
MNFVRRAKVACGSSLWAEADDLTAHRLEEMSAVDKLTETEPIGYETTAEQSVRMCRAAVLDRGNGEPMREAESGPDWNIVRGED